MIAEDQSNVGMVLSENTYRKISRIVLELNLRLKSQVCIFVDRNGYPVEYSGETNDLNMNTLTAVAAACFSTSNEMSEMTNHESHFQHILLEGERRNVYMCSVSSDYLMIIVFEKSVAIGYVRLLTHAAVDKLSVYLDRLKEQSLDVSDLFDDSFRTRLDSEMDQIFGAE